MEVYEIDSLYISPVQQKHWTLVATVSELERLQIGDQEIIRGRDLERLVQDLTSLGMMVNREGLCFLRLPESNVSDQCQVEYYRMFDLFDWSKYRIKSRLNTRWIRNDIANGRPILEILSEKEVELKEMIHQHSKQLDELKEIAAFESRTEEMERKHCAEIEELKRIHTEEIGAFERVKEEMEHEHCEDIEELKRKHAVELATCECEQQKLKSSEEDPSIKYVEDELKLYLSRPCNNTFTLASIFSCLITYFENASPVWKFDDPIEPRHRSGVVYLPPIRDIFTIMLVLLPSCRGKNSPKSYVRIIAHYLGLLRDKLWHFHHSEDVSDTKLQPESRRSILFYDGAHDPWSTFGLHNLPSPDECDDLEVCPAGYEGWGVFYIPGYGFRFGFVFVTR